MVHKMKLTSDAAVGNVLEQDTSIDPYHVVVVTSDFISDKRGVHVLRTKGKRMACFHEVKKGATQVEEEWKPDLTWNYQLSAVDAMKNVDVQQVIGSSRRIKDRSPSQLSRRNGQSAVSSG